MHALASNPVSAFFKDPTVQANLLITAKIVTTGLLTGLTNMFWTRVNSSHSDDDCKDSLLKSFVIGLIVGSGFQTLRAVNFFSIPVIKNLGTKIAENPVWKFFATI